MAKHKSLDKLYPLILDSIDQGVFTVDADFVRVKTFQPHFDPSDRSILPGRRLRQGVSRVARPSEPFCRMACYLV